MEASQIAPFIDLSIAQHILKPTGKFNMIVVYILNTVSF